VNQTPKIAMGRVPVTVHILTPGMKPIQVTQDMPTSGANIIRR
jgi:ATP-dependent helicase HrpB